MDSPSQQQQEDRGSNGSVSQSLLSVGFNQDYGHFAIGTQTGFRVYSSDPFSEMFRREFAGAGLTIVEMLFLSNIFALVGGRFSPNKVMIWDDHHGRCIGELSFRSAVRGVRLRRDRIVVVLEAKIYVYNFADLKLLHQIETLGNTRALCVVSSAPGSCVLACPGQHKGEVRVELYSAKKTRFLQTHDSDVAALALSTDGELLATASSKGTLVRVFSTANGSKLHEVRRGADRAEIYSIAFSANAHWLAVSSDKGTVHVFALKQELGSSSSVKRRGRSSSLISFASTTAGAPLSLVKGVLPGYFSSERSFAQFRVPEETRTIVAFGPQKNTIVIVGANGSYYRCSFDETHGGEMVQVLFERFMKHEETEEEETGAE